MNFRILKFIGVFVAILFFNFLSIVSTKAQFSGGWGTQNSPYLISSKEDLEELADSVKNNNISWPTIGWGLNWSHGKYFEITQDITDPVIIPIGENFLY